MTSASTIEADSITLAVADRIARVSLANPGKRNAFTWRMYDQLEAIATELQTRDDVSVVVFRGTPEDGFAAGTDIRQFVDFETGAEGVEYERRVGAVLSAVAAIPVPTIAAVELTAVGAGLALAATCDLVVAERGSRFGAPIARTLGNCLPAALVRRLRDRIGSARADTMLLTARLVDAEDLAATGFVTLCDAGGLTEAVDAVAARIVSAAPLTLRSLKEIGRRLDAAATPDDTDLLERCYGSDDFRDGVRAFLTQRRPEWRGR
jgi:enoyl-CoA hydratase/carnithine racemase